MFKRTQLPYSHTFPFHKHKINFQVFGTGKPVIFVHGAFTSSSSYLAGLKLLAKHYKVYVIDLPGFGASDVIKGKVHNTKLFSEALSAFIKKHNLTSAPILALSLGVITAVKTAASGRTKGKLLLFSPPGHPDKGLLTKLFANFPIPVRRALVSTYWGRKNILLPAASANTGTQKGTSDLLLTHFSYTSNQAMVDTNYIQEIYSYPRYLKKVKNRVVFIFGEHDRMKKEKLDMVKKYVEVPGGGHNVFSDSPKTVVKILRTLL
jgi:pimeloyl-ACP methyl ester carboxylesterase